MPAGGLLDRVKQFAQQLAPETADVIPRPSDQQNKTMGRLEEVLAQGVKDDKIPHAVVCATNADGSWTYSHTTGSLIHGSTSSSPDNDIKPDAEFMLASSTKLLTTIVVLQAVEKGLVGLDDDIGRYIPELAGQGILKGFDGEDEPILEERKTALTLRLLVTHSSGATYDVGSPDLLKYNKQRNPTWESNTAGTVVARFAYPLLFEPGSSWAYGTGLDWAGKVIESLTGKTLETLVREGIADPLGGLESLTFFPYTADHEHLGKRVPSLTMRTPEGKLVPHTAPFMNIDPQDGMGGHGGYASTPDYLAVLRSLLASDGKLLRPETVEAMFTPQLTPGSAEALKAFMRTPASALFIGEWKPEWELNWGLGGILLMGDGDGRRKRGTLSWGGVANTFWLVDRSADLALAWGTQVLPPGDKGVEEMISAVEFDMYQKRGVKFQ